jgi:phosphohistidine phosphatase
MEVYLLRHAIAADRDPNRWPDDRDRPLTDRGRRRLRRIARGMKKLALRFDAVLSSPYARARETAEIVADRLDFEIIYTSALTPEGGFGQLVTELQNLHPVPRRVLLVGHEPDLGELATRLLCGQPGGWLHMKKGGMCKIIVDHLDVVRPRAHLGWALEPAQLRQLG